MENFVQLAALVAKTNVGEVRRSLRAIILSTIIRPFHQWAKEYLEDKEDNRPRHIKGSARGMLLIKYIEMFAKKAERARQRAIARVGASALKKVMDRLTSKDAKTSAIERKRKMNEFAAGLQKKRKIFKQEEATGVVDMPVYMVGGVIFRHLTMNRSCDDCSTNWKKRNFIECAKPNCCMAAVHAELAIRKIKLTKEQHKKMNIKEKWIKIRDDEAKHWNVGERAKESFNIKDMKYLRPKSELMKGLVDMSMKEYEREKGISISNA